MATKKAIEPGDVIYTVEDHRRKIGITVIVAYEDEKDHGIRYGILAKFLGRERQAKNVWFSEDGAVKAAQELLATIYKLMEYFD